MKTITLLLASLLSICCFAQIEVRQKEDESPFKEIEEKILSTLYDSLNNDPGRNLGGFIGQRLLMNKKNNSSYASEFDKKTYAGFYTDIHSEPKSVYKGITSEGYSKETKTDINALYGKYFTYLDYEITKLKSSYSDNFNIYLKLLDENNDTLYFEYIRNVSAYFLDPNEEYPFITEGYYKKSIQELKGKKVQKGYSLYTCLDVFVEENSDNLTYKLQDSNGKVETVEFSSYSKVRGFKQLNFEYDSTYLSQEKSTFKALTKNKSEGGLNISTSGTEILIMLYFSPNTCFSTDDMIELKFSNDKKINEYYRGKITCKGVAYIRLDITIDRHLEWLEKLVKDDFQSAIIAGTTSDYIIFSPKDYGNIKSCIKAHYMNILEN